MPSTQLNFSPVAADLYSRLRKAVAPFGDHREEVKKTCIHLARGSAFMGVHPRKEHLLVTLKSGHEIKSKRIVKSEQASRSRWYVDLKIASPEDIDKTFLGWARKSYDLCGD